MPDSDSQEVHETYHLSGIRRSLRRLSDTMWSDSGTSVRSIALLHGYDPPLTQAEYQRLSGLTVAKMEALPKAREVRVTRKQEVAESRLGSFSWKNLAKNRLVPRLRVFLACLRIGA